MVAKRSWAAAREKCDREGICRVCAGPYPEAAHLIPRSRIKPGPAESPLNISPFLSWEEQAYCVSLVGLEEARRRLTNQREAA